MIFHAVSPPCECILTALAKTKYRVFHCRTHRLLGRKYENGIAATPESTAPKLNVEQLVDLRRLLLAPLTFCD